MPRSDLPFGSEFSPDQIDLAVLLELADEHGADWKNGFENAVRARYFAGHRTSDYNRSKLANNTKLSMRAYGLIGDRDATLTETGRVLHGLRGDDAVLHEAFARHILKNCQGMNFVQCLIDMQAAGEKIDLTTLRRSLGERGIVVPRGGKHMSTLRLWLEKAGVFVSRYRVDQRRLNEILDLGVEDFEALATLSAEQRAYIKALSNVDGGGPHLSNDIEQLAASTYGVTFNEKNLPKQVLYPLREKGYIELVRGTREGGRGAKPFLITATDKLAADVIAPLVTQLERQVQHELRPLLRKASSRRPRRSRIRESSHPGPGARSPRVQADAVNRSGVRRDPSSRRSDRRRRSGPDLREHASRLLALADPVQEHRPCLAR